MPNTTQIKLFPRPLASAILFTTPKFHLETSVNSFKLSPWAHSTTRLPSTHRGGELTLHFARLQFTSMSVEEKVEARADGDAVVGEKKKRTDDEGGDLAGDEDRSAQKAKVDASESDAALARALGGVPDADAEPSAPPDLGLSEVRPVDSHPNAPRTARYSPLLKSHLTYFSPKTNDVRATAWRFAGSSPTTTT